MISGRLLLIIEAEENVRILTRTLDAAGHEVLLARGVLDGLDMARRENPQLVITELGLSGMNGRELATNLRADKNFSQVPILTILSPHNTRERELCIAAGINGFLDDPLEPRAIPLQIQFFLSGGSEAFDDSARFQEVKEQYLQDVVKGLEARIRELERKNMELRRLDDMKDNFIQLTAHELRTPLTLITGYSRLIEDHPPLRRLMANDPGIAPLLQGLDAAINRMQSVIEEVLTTSRIITRRIELNMTTTNMGAVVRRVIQFYSDALRERRLHVVFDERQFPTEMRADEGLLQQMVSNLFSNAIKYTPDGGNIYLQAQIVGSSVRFSIRDTGIGIDPRMHEKIFERMTLGNDIMQHSTSKTTFRGGGLGLGLAICRGIAEAHGGKIWVESAGYDPDHLPGSEFIVILPMVATPSTKPIARIRRLTSRLPRL